MINPEGEDILLTDVVEGDIQVSHLFYNCYILLYIYIYIYIYIYGLIYMQIINTQSEDGDIVCLQDSRLDDAEVTIYIVNNAKTCK